MIEGFEKLSENQFETCRKSIAWITVLIAGADGKIDKEEVAWAKKVTKIRSYNFHDSLIPFYQSVGEDFSEVLEDLISNLSDSTSENTATLSRRLSQLNDILPLLENKLAYQLYKSYTSFANHVAKSSGGFLGFFSVSTEEKRLMALPMVNEIVYLGEEEE